MRRLLPALLGLGLGLAGCGGTQAAIASPTPPDPINISACQQFAKAADDLKETAKIIDQNGGSFLIEATAGSALEDMTAGAKVARGEIQASMERAVAAVQTMESKARAGEFLTPLRSEWETARLTLVDVERVCAAGGAQITLIAV